jgi:hypothetical protein
MSGPIVRSAPSKKFSANWDVAFGAKSAAPKRGATGKGSARQIAKKTAKKKKK